MRAYNFGSSGRNLAKFYQRMWPIAGVIVDTNFARGALYKIWEGKKVPNLARFVTTFDYDRKYLRNGSTYRKSEKYWINNISSPIRRKKIGEQFTTCRYKHQWWGHGKKERLALNLIHHQLCFGPGLSYQKVIDAHVDPPKWTFFGILNFGR